MAKGNGNTRVYGLLSLSASRAVRANNDDAVYRASNDDMGQLLGTSYYDNMVRFMDYDERVWQKTLFNQETGGYVVTELSRIPKENANQNVKDVFEKEQGMCRDLAGFGFGVRHLYEAPGIGSADIDIPSGRHSIVQINGKTADLKALKNSNNIRKQAIDTFEIKKKADLIVFKFGEHDRKIPHEIEKLSKKGWHGIYYYAGENTRYDF